MSNFGGKRHVAFRHCRSFLIVVAFCVEVDTNLVGRLGSGTSKSLLWELAVRSVQMR